MKLPHRRNFLHLAAGVAALPAVSRFARAQSYPARPVRIIVPIAAGGGTDIVARLISQWLSERLGQPVVIENRPGAGTNIGTEVVVRAPADGYTLLLVSSDSAINATLYEKLSFNFIRDIAPVAGIVRLPFLMLVNPSVPAKTVPEFIAHAKANPGKINMASPDRTAALGRRVVQDDGRPQPGPRAVSGGAPALTDLISGQVQVMFLSPAASIEYIRSGRLRALAVTSATRWEGLPDLPTVVDFLPGYEASAWFGVGAPKNTPSEIIDKLNTEINAALSDPKLKARLADLGGKVLPGSSTDFGKLSADETEKWAKVIKFAGIKAE